MLLILNNDEKVILIDDSLYLTTAYTPGLEKEGLSRYLNPKCEVR